MLSAVAIGVCGLALLALASLAILNNNPAVAAQTAEVLRHVIGEENVARLETWVLGWQDTLTGLVFDAGGDQPRAPWPTATPAPSASPLARPTPTLPPNSTQSGPPPTARPTASPPPITPTAAPTALSNQPALLKPFGHLPGEGAWSVYLTDSDGKPVAYRTFLQPDPQRPYAVAAIVALDLTATRLHFVLGTLEPASPEQMDRPGRIPSADLKSGLLLAAFNGGFKAEHGLFGAAVNGKVVLAPRDGLGTVAMYDDGHVALGPWGNDGNPGEVYWANGLRNWRQNGPLIVQQGQVNPHTADDAPQDWGYTVKSDTATWRSGVGLSADGNTLYYLAGPSLTLPVLATAMADTGANNGIQLDINAYWVDFEAIHPNGDGLFAQPLLDGMKDDSRYLHTFERDFFYLTLNSN